MPKRAARHTEEVLALLTWEWQDAEDIMQIAISRMAPGTALRRYEKYEAALKAKRGKGYSTETAIKRTDAEKIRMGGRIITNQSISSLVESGLAEVTGGRKERRIRRKERRTQNLAPEVMTVDREVVMDRLRKALTDPDWLAWVVDSVLDAGEEVEDATAEVLHGSFVRKDGTTTDTYQRRASMMDSASTSEWDNHG